MSSKKDITTTNDIKLIVNTFYGKIRNDKVLAPFFTETVQTNWDQHLAKMYKFWANVVFYSGGYNGNPMQQHMAIHEKHPLRKTHFKRWLQLFRSSVDELFSGENSENIKKRAENISTVMQIKILKQL